MVAAHNSDLDAAAACGLQTAFVARPTEYGPGQATDLHAADGVDVEAGDFLGLADALRASRTQTRPRRSSPAAP